MNKGIKQDIKRIVECVPNISEGQERGKIDLIVNAAAAVSGVTVLDVDAGVDTNRTVITFAGSPEAVLEGAYQLIKRASELIDMQGHKGAHPRMGATDVCPFIPIAGVTMDECVELSKELGARVGKELGIPVYLYEYAASSPERRSLSDIRKGEYESLSEKLKVAAWRPDFGPAVFNRKSGATVIGARKFLIAYNVNLNTRSKKLANEIAKQIRESGYPRKDSSGNAIKDANGNPITEPGKLQHCKAVGWFIESYGCAQVSINLTDYSVTGMQHAFDACEEVAATLGVRVTGSELVGLVPKEAILEAGTHYLLKQRTYSAPSESAKISSAIRSLGLSELAQFDPAKRIIENCLADAAPLAAMRVYDFIDELSSDSVAPGGGSVASLGSSLGAALMCMVCALTFAKPKLKEVHPKVLELGKSLELLKQKTRDLLDADTKAFNAVMSAMRSLPKGLPDNSPEVIAGKERIELSYKRAAEIPFEVVKASLETMQLGSELAGVALENALSDIAVGVEMAQAGLKGAAYNVRINLGEIRDKKFVSEMEGNLNECMRSADSKRAAIGKTLKGRGFELY